MIASRASAFFLLSSTRCRVSVFVGLHRGRAHAMDLIVEGRGTFVGKHQGRLRVTREGKVVTEAPLIHLEQVLIVDRGVTISSDVVASCTEEGIPIHFVSGIGRVQASIYSAGLTGTVLSRRAQLLAYTTERGLGL